MYLIRETQEIKEFKEMRMEMRTDTKASGFDQSFGKSPPS
jgi:hypothetical protein